MWVCGCAVVCVCLGAWVGGGCKYVCVGGGRCQQSTSNAAGVHRVRGWGVVVNVCIGSGRCQQSTSNVAGVHIGMLSRHTGMLSRHTLTCYRDTLGMLSRRTGMLVLHIDILSQHIGIAAVGKLVVMHCGSYVVIVK